MYVCVCVRERERERERGGLYPSWAVAPQENITKAYPECEIHY